MNHLEHCPIETTLTYIGKKWTINLLRDMVSGRHRFKDFLEANPTLSTKMLSARLKDMEKIGLIEKHIVTKSPLLIEYRLTDKGRALNRVLFELTRFSLEHCSSEVFGNDKECCAEHLEKARKLYAVPPQ